MSREQVTILVHRLLLLAAWATVAGCAAGDRGGSADATTSLASATANLGVTWSIEEASGCGSVSQGGTYSAPGAAATCHVVATSKADGSRSARATVTVGGGGGGTGCGTGCLTYQPDVALGSDPANTATCDLVSWVDKDGNRRRVYLVNDTPQPFYGTPTGGYIQRYEWSNAGALRQCDNAGGTYGGWGYAVNHGDFPHRAWMDSKEDGYGTTSRFLPIGDHHAVWEFRTKMGTAGINTTPTVDLTVHYLFKDGDDQFQYAVAFDTSAISSPASVRGLLGADSRTPYGSLNWDGLNGGSERRSGFRLGSDNVIQADLGTMTWQNQTYGTGYDLTPFVEVWNTRQLGGVQYDDEMGYVQTRLQRNHRGGHGRGTANGAASGAIGTSDVSLFDYQMMEYQAWTGERTCWQAAGPTGVNAQGVTNGFEDYSLSVLIDRRSERGVQRLLDEANAIHDPGTSLTATTGRVATAGPEAPGMPVLRRWDKAGFDQVYRNWVLVAAGNAAAGTLTVTAGKALRNPTLVVAGYTAPSKPAVAKNGATLVEGRDYYASLDAVRRQVWVTFLSSFSGSTSFSIAGPPDATGIAVSGFTPSPASASTGAATPITFTAQIDGATSAALDLSALGGGSSVAMARSGSTFTASHTIPAGARVWGPLLVPLTATGAAGSRGALTAVLVKNADLAIYSGGVDHVVPGWEPNGHLTKVTTGSPYEGTTQLQVTYTATGAVAADVGFDGTYDLTPYKYMGIALRGPSLTGQRLSLELRAAGNFGSGMRSYGSFGSYTKLWIPLASFPVDLTQVQGIRLQVDGTAGSGSVFLDDITFTSVVDPVSSSEAFSTGYAGAVR